MSTKFRHFVAIDVETPNGANDRVCSLGLILVDDGVITRKLHFLVDPECDFDDFNCNLHGIYPFMVKGERTFPAVWEEILPFIQSRLVVAHNARFDLSVIRKLVSHYALQRQTIQFVDTLEIARNHLNLESYKLGLLAEQYDIQIDAHNALSDSEVCARLLLHFLEEGEDVDSFVHSYELDGEEERERNHFRSKKVGEDTKALQTLQGILAGITCDQILTEQEVLFLEKWLLENTKLKGNYPYDLVFQKVEDALEDGILEQHELEEMLVLFQKVFNPLNDSKPSSKAAINLKEKSICLSGEFDFGSKNEVAEYLEKQGAVIQSSVTRKTNIVLVGSKGNAAWVTENYGTKVKKAMELKEAGLPIQILKECEVLG